jgi:hypothetical protein
MLWCHRERPESRLSHIDSEVLQMQVPASATTLMSARSTMLPIHTPGPCGRVALDGGGFQEDEALKIYAPGRYSLLR